VNATNERDRLQHVVETQEISQSDVERMHAETKTLEENLASSEAQKQLLQKQIFDYEVSISKKIEEIEKQIMTFHEGARNLALIPSNAKRAAGVNYTLPFSIHQPDVILDHIRSIVKAGLESHRDLFHETGLRARDDFIATKERADRVEEQNIEKRQENEFAENKLKKLEAQYKREKDRLREVMLSKHKEQDDLINEINRLRDLNADSLARSKKSVEVLKLEYEEAIEACNHEKEEVTKQMVEAMETLHKHKAFITDNLGSLSKYFSNFRANVNAQQQSQTKALNEVLGASN
jgi:SMC interacting uncharacterized protein involved in chromosome segregation